MQCMRFDPPFELGSVIAGKYRLDGFLASGGMGAVFQATNIAIGRKVALKILSGAVAGRPDLKRRFQLEARAAAVIAHRGIVDVLDMGETEDGRPFIVMEYLEGANVGALLKRLGTLTAAQAVAVIDPVLDALAAAHQAGVIHRDVKPANIFVCVRPERAIKLLDFGVSRFSNSAGLTSTGTTVGTPRYMSPEQILGEKDLGPAADLYSVGAVLYHLLTGRPPFEADSDIATLARTLTEQHQPLGEARPDLDPSFCRQIDGLLARSPIGRPRDARRLRTRLATLVPEKDDQALYAAAEDEAAVAAEAATPPRATPPRPARPCTPSPPSRPDALLLPEAPPPPTRDDASHPLSRGRVAAIVIIALLLGAALASWLHAAPPSHAVNPPLPQPPPPPTLAAPALLEPPRATSATPEAVDPPEPAPQPLEPAAGKPRSTSRDAGRPPSPPKRRATGLDIQERNPYR